MSNSRPPEPRTARRPRRVFRWILQGAFLIGVVILVHGWQTRHLATGVAPDFAGTLLDGETIKLSELRGQPALLHFWATWCPVCGIEQDGIQRIARDYRVLSVALDELRAPEMSQWLEERGLAYPVVLDSTGRIAELFGVRGVPTSVIIDADGRIRSVSVGYTTEAGLRFRLWWAGRTTNR